MSQTALADTRPPTRNRLERRDVVALVGLVVAAIAIPLWLAGGLRAENVAEAIDAVKPYGVDVCSGVRTGGPLDAAKVRAFVSAVHTARAA